MNSYISRIKPSNKKRVGGGWIYLNKEALKHLGVNPGDKVEVVLGGNKYDNVILIFKIRRGVEANED